MPEKVIVAMSGGVDSSVAAALLQQQGYQVEGVFMKNWSPESMQSLTDCPWEQDQADAAAVCAHLQIPFRSINFEREYKERVVDYFLAEYAAGRTPNPDVMCNKEVKFAVFLEQALAAGAEKVATGHYAQIRKMGETYHLYKGIDPKKDQSYFLYTLGQEQLSRVIFPLGGYRKPEVRELAKQFKLPTAEKKDSQGICFIGHLDLKKFLMEHISAKPGETYLLPPYAGQAYQERRARAERVGEHDGVMFYTVGERAGQVVDNGRYRQLRDNADVPVLYVLDKDVEGNLLYITEAHNDPGFLAGTVWLEEWSSPTEHFPQGPLEGHTCQVRYHQEPAVRVHSITSYNNRVRVETGTTPAVWATAAGQSLVVYGPDDEVVGGGVIGDFERLAPPS